jgi:hypothetical protein
MRNIAKPAFTFEVREKYSQLLLGLYVVQLGPSKHKAWIWLSVGMMERREDGLGEAVCSPSHRITLEEATAYPKTCSVRTLLLL